MVSMKTLGYAVILLFSYVFPGYAQQVYDGCATPPSTFRHVWYIDPANGKTPAAGGNGSQAHPWNSLQAVFWTTTGYTYPLLTTVPYLRAGTGWTTGPKAGPIQPGDEVLLMSGSYGPIKVGQYAVGIVNSSYLTIAAAPGATPILQNIDITGSKGFSFNGLKVQSLRPASFGGFLILVGDQGASWPTENIVFQHMTINSQDVVGATWSQAQWVANGSNGVRFDGLFTTCITMGASHISNVRFGVGLFAQYTEFNNNELDHFGDDGIDHGASNVTIAENYIHDNLNIGDGNHEDAIQGFEGELPAGATAADLTYDNVLIEGNKIIRQTDPHLPFPTYLQGIDAFDGNWANLSITNNVVITSACWGIAFSSVHGGAIVNNTAVNDGLLAEPGNCAPSVSIGDKTHEGSSSNNVVVRNNLANQISVDNLDFGVEMDHNVAIIPGELNFYVNSVLQYYTKAGTYSNGVNVANIIVAGGPAAEFVEFDPSALTYNVELKAGAAAIGAGTATGAPTVDILGVPRKAPYDAGAYSYPQ